MTDSDRIDRLERELQELRQELAELRAERLERAARPLMAPPVAPRATSRAMPAGIDALSRHLHLDALPHDRAEVETAVGRYGTVAIAALLILMGVGAFLTWAIGVVSIGPRMRVGIGVVVAALLAAAGWRLRTRDPAQGARRFGDVLLALSLAVIHVDAWGAGPFLGLLPAGLALGIAAAASAALALLAWRERDQALFVVGVGGALVAPFVTSAGPGHPYVLPIYGWLVLTSGALALPRHAVDRESPRWPFASRLLALGVAAYVAAMIGDAAGVLGTPDLWTARPDVPVLFALACAVGALALGGAAAGWLALAHATATLGAVVALALRSSHGAPRLAAYAAAADVVAYAGLWLVLRLPTTRSRGELPRALTTAVILPLALLAAALVALGDPLSNGGAALGAVWAALAVGAAAADPAPRRSLLGAHVAVAGLASALVPALLLRDDPLARTAALAAHGALFAFVFARVRRRGALAPPLLVLGAASFSILSQLHFRPAFAYRPFLTLESLVALTVVGGWIVLAQQTRRTSLPNGDDPIGGTLLSRGERGAIVAAAGAAALMWGREELAHAGSPEIATVLLVGYFAAAGIAAILAGRMRRVPAARQAGLALALYAALKALVQASALDAVGLRVASYLIVGVFLLGVGYLYRTPEPRAAPAPIGEPEGLDLPNVGR